MARCTVVNTAWHEDEGLYVLSCATPDCDFFEVAFGDEPDVYVKAGEHLKNSAASA